MAQNGKLIPQLDQQSTWELNLTVLQRWDPQVEDILITAGHVTLYEFNVELSEWSRKDVEGSLFVVKRRSKPRFQFIVMNRRSTANLVEDLLHDFEYEVQVPYLLYQNATQQVNGIWFYDPRECEEVVKLFSRILSAYSKISPKSKAFTAQSNKFQESEAVPTEGPLEPTSVPVSSVEFSDDPLERFFNNALHPIKYEPPSSPVVLPVAGTLPISFHPSVISPGLAQVPSKPPTPPRASSFTNQPATDIRSTNPGVLLKPSVFVSLPLTPRPPTLPGPPPSMQPSVKAPFLQPFSSPTPSPSRAAASILSHGPIINKDRVRDALYQLVQNDRFIDMVYQEVVKADRT